MIVARTCNNCQAPYDAESKYLKRGQGLFCSRSCASSWKHKNSIKPEPNVRCSYCFAELYRIPSKVERNNTGFFFCTKEHQDLAYADPSISRILGPKVNKVLNETTFKNLNYSCSSPNCSNYTTREFCKHCVLQQKISAWLSGDVSVTWYGASRKDPAKFVKRYLIETRGDRCELCGFDKKTPDGQSIIQMDHIDGDYTNNLIDNLRLLCPNCHAMTITYGSKNKGNGRAYRKKYYMSVAGLPTDSIEGA